MPFTDVETLHPRLSDFGAFYERELAPYLAEQEIARQKALGSLIKAAMFIVPAGIAAFVALWYFGLFEDGFIGFFVGFMTLVVILGALAFAGRDLMSLKADVKQTLMIRICGHLGFTYREDPAEADIAWFRQLSLVPSHDRRSLEDEISGNHEQVTFSLCEAHLEDKRTRTDSDGRTETYYVTVFRGLLARFTFPKEFSGRTIVLSDGGFLGNLFGGVGGKGERVRLEDPRFEKLFEVYSSDQVEARYLLTPTFMERATELTGLLKGKLQLAFDRDRLLLTINGGDDRFEGGSMFSSFNDPEAVAKIAREVGIVFRIIDALRLDLSTRT